jgi:hypothetical protein
MATASDPTSQARATEVLTAHGIATDITGREDTVREDTAGEPQAGPAQAVIDAPGAVRRPRTAPLATMAVNGATRVNGTRPHQLPLAGKAEGQQS